MNDDVIRRLQAVLEERKKAQPETSYVASLYNKGINKILEKVGEETTEVIIAAKDLHADQSGSHMLRREVVKETADLWFHTLVMLSHVDIDSQELLEELDRRFGTSGHTEKTSRTN